MEKLLLNIKEIAKVLGVSTATVNKWKKSEGFPHVKIGKSVRFREADVRAWLDTKVTK